MSSYSFSIMLFLYFNLFRNSKILQMDNDMVERKRIGKSQVFAFCQKSQNKSGRYGAWDVVYKNSSGLKTYL